MKYSFHPDALAEYIDEITYYAEISPKVAENFIQAIEQGIERIRANPNAWSIIEEDIHRHLINRFSYGIYYCIEENHIVIYAIMHMNRYPDYWKNRLKK